MGEIKDFVELYIKDSDILQLETNKIALDLQNNIKKEAPYDQGRLKRSIRVDTRMHDTFSIITGYYDESVAPHGDFVLMGTKPHVITPKSKKALKTPYGVFKKVNHPGTKPNDFLGRGLAATIANY